MPSFLTTTAQMTHTSRLPAGTTRAQALAMLSDHAFFLSCDPHLDKFEPIPPSALAQLSPPPSVPDEVKAQLRRSGDDEPGPDRSVQTRDEDEHQPDGPTPTPTCYRVTDIVHAVPAGLWDTSVVSTYEFSDLRDGVFVRVRSPLSVVMDTFWRVRQVGGCRDGNGEGTDGGGVGGGGEGEGEGAGQELALELVEDVTIQCSRLLMGLVKGQCENGWGKIHGKMLARLAEEVKQAKQGMQG